MIVSRRDTLVLMGGAALSALGCYRPWASAATGPGTPRATSAATGTATAAASAQGRSVPDVTSYGSKLDAIIRDIDQFLGARAGSFPPGFLANEPEHWPRGIQEVNSSLGAALASTGGRPLRTPLLGAHRNVPRYFQLGGAEVTHFSLIAGHDNQGYTIHNSWLRWLLEDDNCDFEVAGSTEFGSCAEVLHHADCRIQLTAQDFRMPTGKPKRLVWTNTSAGPYSAAELAAHKEHTSPWEGCGSFDSKPTLTQCPLNSGS